MRTTSPPVIWRRASAPASWLTVPVQGSAGWFWPTSISCLDRAARRLARFRPQRVQANLLEPLPFDLAPSDSVGLTYVLHCLPGSMEKKLKAVDHLKPLMTAGAVLFGATILGRGITPNPAARALLDLYNAKGVFNNRGDDLEGLRAGLEQRFAGVEIAQRGLVALFRAR